MLLSHSRAHIALLGHYGGDSKIKRGCPNYSWNKLWTGVTISASEFLMLPLLLLLIPPPPPQPPVTPFLKPKIHEVPITLHHADSGPDHRNYKSVRLKALPADRILWMATKLPSLSRGFGGENFWQKRMIVREYKSSQKLEYKSPDKSLQRQHTYDKSRSLKSEEISWQFVCKECAKWHSPLLVSLVTMTHLLLEVRKP